MNLREIGFWDDICNCIHPKLVYADTLRPDPHTFVDHQWFYMYDIIDVKDRYFLSPLRKLIWYIKYGNVIESFEHGYSYCRFKCAFANENPKSLGASTLTDGIYCWPEGYYHYITHHHVKPSQAFLHHVEESFSYAVDKAMERESKLGKTRHLWMYCPEIKEPILMPSSSSDWLIKPTSIQLIDVQFKVYLSVCFFTCLMSVTA